MYYWQIRTNIFLLRSIAPLAIVYSVVRLTQTLLPDPLTPFYLPWPVALWLHAEALSYVFLYLPYKYHFLQLPAAHPTALPREERATLFTRCWETVAAPEQYLTGWFRGARAEDIKRENVRVFIRWAFFNAERELGIDDEREVDGYLDAIERRLGRKLPVGWGSAVSLRTTLDKVHCTYRSILWYMCITVVDLITYSSMLFNSFHFHRTSFWALFPPRLPALIATKKSPSRQITYWHRPHASKSRLPVLFIHGVGVGLYPYANFLRDINVKDSYFGSISDTSDSIGIIAVEIMAVSSRLTYQALDRDVLVAEIHEILRFHGWDEYVLVGHSYGTIISTHLLKAQSQLQAAAPRIGPVVLIDPICFLLHLPDVAYNFTARAPSSAKELVLWYFGSMDIGIAHTLGRRFFWSENVLWKEDLVVGGRRAGNGHRDMTVVLSGRDDIVDVRAVKGYLGSGRGAVANGKEVNGASTAAMATSGETDALLKRYDEDQGTQHVRHALREWHGEGLETVWLDGFHHAQAFDFETTRAHLVKIIRTYTQKRT